MVARSRAIHRMNTAVVLSSAAGRRRLATLRLPSDASAQLSIGSTLCPSSFCVQSRSVPPWSSRVPCSPTATSPHVKNFRRTWLTPIAGGEARQRRRGGTTTKIVVFAVTCSSRRGAIVAGPEAGSVVPRAREHSGRHGCTYNRSHFSRIVCHDCGPTCAADLKSVHRERQIRPKGLQIEKRHSQS
jgi:hypothetical protein